MLVKLLPKQITDNWETIKFAMRAAMPELADNSDEAMTEVLESFLLGRLSCWASYRMEEGKTVIDGLITTTVVTDYCSGTKSLLVYTGYAPTRSITASWLDGYKTFSKEAIRLDCKKVVMYSTNDRIIKLMKRMGAAHTTLLSLPLYQNLEEGLDEDIFQSGD